MDKVPVLYSFRRCPYAMRARMAIYVSGLSVELREILLKDKPESMLECSPKGTVPVLVTNDNNVIDESLDVMVWALSQFDPDHWLDAQSDEVNELISENDGSFKQNLDQYKYADRFPENPPEFYRSLGLVFLLKLEEKLQRHMFLMGNSVTLADIAIFPFVRQFSLVDKNWFDASDYPKLKQWLNGFLVSEVFKNIMEKYQPWKQGDDAIIWSNASVSHSF